MRLDQSLEKIFEPRRRILTFTGLDRQRIKARKGIILLDTSAPTGCAVHALRDLHTAAPLDAL
jgi:hypothetical protein